VKKPRLCSAWHVRVTDRDADALRALAEQAGEEPSETLRRIVREESRRRLRLRQQPHPETATT
jgi:hypothetical protein